MNSNPVALVFGVFCIGPMIIGAAFYWLGLMVGTRRIRIQAPIQFGAAQPPRQPTRPAPVKTEDRVGYGKPQ